jgi:hypothetical protein
MSEFDELATDYKSIVGSWRKDELGKVVLTDELIEEAREDVAYDARAALISDLLSTVKGMTKVSRKAIIELLEEYEGS